MNRRHTAIATVWTMCLGGAAALIACGGSSDSGGGSSDSGVGNGNDATTTMPTGTPTSTPMDGSMTPGDSAVVDAALSVTATTNAMTIYAGQTANLDASGMAGGAVVTYNWTLSGAPAGSNVTTSTIVNATTATPALPTDVAGTYVLSVTATSGSQVQQATVSITAVVAHVVYTEEIALPNDGGISGLLSIDTDSNNRRAIMCPFLGVHTVFLNENVPFGQVGAVGAVDTFEGAPSTATKVAFGSPQTTDAGYNYSKLYITDTSSSCVSTDGGPTPQAIYQTVGDAAVSPYVNVMHPRFSPDGSKIAFVSSYSTGETVFGVRPIDQQSTVNVVNIDGSNPVSLGIIADPSAATNGNTYQSLGVARQPEWKDATHVGWTRQEADAGAGAFWEVVVSQVAPIAPGDPTVYMTCGGIGGAPTRVVFLADGSVVAVQNNPQTGQADLLVLKPDATTKACTLVRNLTNLPDAGAAGVQSFALSPDGKTVAYSANNPAVNPDGGPARYLVYTVPVDGSAMPTHVGSTDVVDLAAGIRWVAGGGQLAVTHATEPDGGGFRAIAAIPVGFAAQPSDLVVSDGGSTPTAVGDGDGTGCNASGHGAPSFGFLAGVFGLLGLARRRQRRARTGAAS